MENATVTRSARPLMLRANATARRFYASVGFIETSIDELGEMVAEIRL